VIQFRRQVRLGKTSNRLPFPLAIRQAAHSSKPTFARALRVMAPTLVALSLAGVAHAQGTMDFSGAQTLMGTFNWRNDYVGIEQWSRFIRDDHYAFHTELHRQHEEFAKVWDKNLRSQGFAEAFERQQQRA
jgi:hypothetical protein